eukprot:238693-Amphidinium_carterae.1
MGLCRTCGTFNAASKDGRKGSDCFMGYKILGKRLKVLALHILRATEKYPVASLQADLSECCCRCFGCTIPTESMT